MKPRAYRNNNASETINVNDVHKPVKQVNGELVEVDVPRGTIYGEETTKHLKISL